jgi:hypothetical protein
MTEIETLRAWLQTQMGKLNQIANDTQVSRRTIQRIVNDNDYAVKSSTSSKLKKYMDRASAPESLGA